MMRVGILPLLVVISGCVSNSRPVSETVDTVNADYGQYPHEYVASIKAWAQTNLKDPESARYGHISRPRQEYVVENLQALFGYSVCAAINAKNSYGGYAGSEIFWFFFRDGQLLRSQSTEGFPGTVISRGHDVNCEDGPLPAASLPSVDGNPPPAVAEEPGENPWAEETQPETSAVEEAKPDVSETVNSNVP
jgi:hypothetical protein